MLTSPGLNPPLRSRSRSCSLVLRSSNVIVRTCSLSDDAAIEVARLPPTTVVAATAAALIRIFRMVVLLRWFRGGRQCTWPSCLGGLRIDDRPDDLDPTHR